MPATPSLTPGLLAARNEGELPMVGEIDNWSARIEASVRASFLERQGADVKRAEYADEGGSSGARYAIDIPASASKFASCWKYGTI